jgi:predicted TPR repeat methyltransferase
MNDPNASAASLENPKARLAEAIGLHRQGKLDEAELIYCEILSEYPKYPDALNFLGVLMHQKGQSATGLELIGKAIEFAPDYFDAYFNVGKIYMKIAKWRRAQEFYEQAVKLKPDHAGALEALNHARERLQADEELLAELRQAAEQNPEEAGAHYSYGMQLRKLDQWEESALELRRAIDLQPMEREGYLQLVRHYHMKNRHEDKEALLREWLEHIPDDPNARHMLWAMTGEHTPSRASDEYVVETFDRFAESFDNVLRTIDYRAPQLVAELAGQVLADDAGPFEEVLDAGCGTGLCGPLLKPLCKRLTGVDLSRKMLDKALERECYDQLFEAELTEFIGSCDHFFDLIASADTLVYFGDLSPPAKASFEALKSGGYLIFTVEMQEERNALGYTLKPHGRYSHERDYVKDTLREAGFEIASIDVATLRFETGKAVAGFLVCARKPLSQSRPDAQASPLQNAAGFGALGGVPQGFQRPDARSRKCAMRRLHGFFLFKLDRIHHLIERNRVAISF